ncbi:DUF3558 family protein [Actinomadura rubrisoli]|uniref:DUF3558 domain-containing protein n=1 Tax=Actinomadura rubrisoli TaxID=2530368 RepID=A0A4R5BY57_9ACTN|nr:DUF3558 domain-containing protein [Actinomadura rubrisoli]TDD91149.1 DUF3558 domain-containing protein [Actinomadura rubrisoli]
MRILAGLSGSLLVLALAVTGCGDDGGGDEGGGEDAKGTPSASPGAKSADAGVDVCKLLTPRDLEASFGRPFGDGKPAHQEDSGADQCVWTSTGAASGATFSITVLSQGRLAGAFKSNGASVAELFKQTKLAYPNAKAVKLGDEAFASVSELQVLERDTWYSLSFHGGGGNAVGGLKELARRVVGRR